MEKLKNFFDQIKPLNKEEWTVAMPLFRSKQLRKGECFVKEGEVTNELGFIESGLLRLFYRQDGQEKNMIFFKESTLAGDFFSFLTRSPSIRPIEALEDTRLYCIQFQDLQRLYQMPKWEHIGRRLSEWAYIFAVQRANRLLHDDFETRYLTLLQEQPDLIRRVPQFMIASYLDMTPETLSRIKKRISEKKREKADSVHQSLDGNFFNHK